MHVYFYIPTSKTTTSKHNSKRYLSLTPIVTVMIFRVGILLHSGKWIHKVFSYILANKFTVGYLLCLLLWPHEKLLGIRRVSNPSTSIDPGSPKIGFLVLIQNAGFVISLATCCVCLQTQQVAKEKGKKTMLPQANYTCVHVYLWNNMYTFGTKSYTRVHHNFMYTCETTRTQTCRGFSSHTSVFNLFLFRARTHMHLK